MNKWIKYLISSLSIIISAFLITFLLGIFKETDISEIMHLLSDGFFVPSVIVLGVVALIKLAENGSFDMLGYGIRTAFSAFKKDPRDRKYKTYYDYKKAKEEKEKRDLKHMYIPGLISFFMAMVFVILYYIYM